MSEQIAQEMAVEIKDLELLRKAVQSIEVPELRTNLVLDTERKSARYYNGNMDRCDAVITYARSLTPSEQSRHYEIAMKREPDGKGGFHYRMYADTYDQTMARKIEAVFEEYIIANTINGALEDGAIESEEVREIEGIELAPGDRALRLVYPD